MKRLLLLLSFTILFSAKPAAAESQFLKMAKEIPYQDIAKAGLNDAKKIGSDLWKNLPTSNKILEVVKSPKTKACLTIACAGVLIFSVIKMLQEDKAKAAQKAYKLSLTPEAKQLLKQLPELKKIEGEISQYFKFCNMCEYERQQIPDYYTDEGLIKYKIKYKKLQNKIKAFKISYLPEEIVKPFNTLKHYFINTNNDEEIAVLGAVVKTSHYYESLGLDKALTALKVAIKCSEEDLNGYCKDQWSNF